MRAKHYDPRIACFLSEDTHWNPGNMIYRDNARKISESQDALWLNTYTIMPDINAIRQSGNLYVYCGGKGAWWLNAWWDNSVIGQGDPVSQGTITDGAVSGKIAMLALSAGNKYRGDNWGGLYPGWFVCDWRWNSCGACDDKRCS